jgi:hypothetical protein
MANVAEKTASKYTPAMVARMRDEAPLNQAKATALAAEFGDKFTARSVIAKAVRESIAYERKVAVTKTGAPVEQKEAIVTEIAQLVGANLDGLEKAPKPALQALRDYLAA